MNKASYLRAASRVKCRWSCLSEYWPCGCFRGSRPRTKHGYRHLKKIWSKVIALSVLTEWIVLLFKLLKMERLSSPCARWLFDLNQTSLTVTTVRCLLPKQKSGSFFNLWFPFFSTWWDFWWLLFIIIQDAACPRFHTPNKDDLPLG